MTPIEVYAETR